MAKNPALPGRGYSGHQFGRRRDELRGAISEARRLSEHRPGGARIQRHEVLRNTHSRDDHPQEQHPTGLLR